MRFLPSMHRVTRGLLSLLLVAFATFAHGAGAPPEIRLYVLDCGRLDMRDMGMFDESGALDGKPGTMSVPCFLIRHPKGYLLWDTGLGDALADRPDGVELQPGNSRQCADEAGRPAQGTGPEAIGYRLPGILALA